MKSFIPSWIADAQPGRSTRRKQGYRHISLSSFRDQGPSQCIKIEPLHLI